MKTKRFNAWVLSALMVVFTLFPQKPSYAVLPALAVTAITSGAGAAAVDVGATAVATLVGSSIVALGVVGQLPGQQTYNELRIPLVDDKAKQDSAMPPPSAPATAQPTGGIPADASSYAYPCSESPTGASCGGQQTMEWCSSWLGYGQRTYAVWCKEVVSGDNARNFGLAGSNGSLPPAGYIPPDSSCPPGYSGSGCALQSPRLVTPDGKNDVQRTASGFTFGPSVDVDSGGASLSPSGSPSTTPSPKVTVVGKNSKGEPIVIEVVRNADATTNVRLSTQTQVSNNTVVRQQDLTLSPDSVVITALDSVMEGQITDIDSANPTVTADPNQKVFSSDIQFPSDYARVGEAAQAANILKPSLDLLNDKFTLTQTVDDPTIPDYPDVWASTFDGITGWHLPSHTSECPTGSFVFNNKIFVMDTHCQLISNYFGALSAAMNVVWFVLAFAVVMGA